MNLNLFFYLNDDYSVRSCTVEEWSEQIQYMMEHDKKHVQEDTINGKWVSTVWLGIDHNHFGGSPLIFETMVFDDDSGLDEYCERYSTWGEAIEGHKKAVQWVLEGCKHV